MFESRKFSTYFSENSPSCLSDLSDKIDILISAYNLNNILDLT